MFRYSIKGKNWNTVTYYKSAHLMIPMATIWWKQTCFSMFGFQQYINHSSFQRCKQFNITRTIINKPNVKMFISSVFVDVDMFYKSIHHYLYQVWRACNAEIGAKCQWHIRYLVGGNLLLQMMFTEETEVVTTLLYRLT